MNQFALIIALCLLTGIAQATFELQDPAAQIYEEQQKPQEIQQEQLLKEDTFCALESDTGKCWCVHKETGQAVTLVFEECVIRASKPANDHKQ